MRPRWQTWHSHNVMTSRSAANKPAFFALHRIQDMAVWTLNLRSKDVSVRLLSRRMEDRNLLMIQQDARYVGVRTNLMCIPQYGTESVLLSMTGNNPGVRRNS